MSGDRPSPLRSGIAVARLTWSAAAPVLAGQLVVMLAQAAAPVAATWCTKLVVDALVHGGSVVMPAAGLAAAGVVAAALSPVGVLLGNQVSRRTGLLATARLFTATNGLDGLARFEDPAFADKLRLAQQAPGGLGQLTSAAVGLGRGGLTLVGLLGALLVISPALTAALLLGGLPMLVAQLRFSRRRTDLALQLGHGERREAFYGQLLTTVRAAQEVRLFGIGSFLRDRIVAERRTADRARRGLDRRVALAEALLGGLGATAAGAGVVWAVLQARSGRIGVGDVAALLGAVAATQAALYAVISAVSSAHRSVLAFEQYLAVLAVPNDLPVAAPARELPPLRGAIELRDVWFRYGPDRPWVLRGVTLTIPAGGSVGLVGLNGAGKSTLVKLLCRFYDPTRGEIRWDGVDVRDVPVAALRARLSCVFQDYMTYDLSAAENIGVGDLTALDDPGRLHRAARRAGVHETLQALPAGYDTPLTRIFVGPRTGPNKRPAAGVLLSGGQWQRVALARSFLRDAADLVVLDEPSAGLDVDAEHELHTAMREHRAGRATLLISHRLNAVRDADTIVVLADGVVAERGSHQELIRTGGTYARLFTRQAAGYQTAQPVPTGR